MPASSWRVPWFSPSQRQSPFFWAPWNTYSSMSNGTFYLDIVISVLFLPNYSYFCYIWLLLSSSLNTDVIHDSFIFYPLEHLGPLNVFHIAVIQIFTKRIHRVYHYLYTARIFSTQLYHFRTVPPRWKTLSTKTHSATIWGFLQGATFVLFSTPLSVAF